MQEVKMLLRYRKPCLWALRLNMPLKPLWNQQFCLVTIAASKITPIVSGMKQPFVSLTVVQVRNFGRDQLGSTCLVAVRCWPGSSCLKAQWLAVSYGHQQVAFPPRWSRTPPSLSQFQATSWVTITSYLSSSLSPVSSSDVFQFQWGL